ARGILDGLRRARGGRPEDAAVRETVVRRRKRQIIDNGNPRFKARDAREIPVVYPADEREIHGLLQEFAQARRKRLNQTRGRRAADLVTLLLKKRLFSSPAAFAHTVAAYMETLKSKTRHALEPEDEWLEDFFDDTATLDDESLDEAESDALILTAPLVQSRDEELALLQRM